MTDKSDVAISGSNDFKNVTGCSNSTSMFNSEPREILERELEDASDHNVDMVGVVFRIIVNDKWSQIREARHARCTTRRLYVVSQYSLDKSSVLFSTL
jgi:hypothetical protein